MNRKTTETTSYELCVQTALKRYADAEWLGDHSPLAQPYFLGAPSNAMPSAVQRGIYVWMQYIFCEWASMKWVFYFVIIIFANVNFGINTFARW